MTEFGKSPLLGVQKLKELGYNLVIYPVTGLRLAMQGIEEGFAQLRDAGTQKDLLNVMQPRTRLYELLGYEAYNAFDANIFNFKL
jgi:methylisocitrate lyase